MNLIGCQKDCVHQQDGFCYLDQTMMRIGPYPVDGCCYYRKKGAAPPNRQRTPPGQNQDL